MLKTLPTTRKEYLLNLAIFDGHPWYNKELKSKLYFSTQLQCTRASGELT